MKSWLMALRRIIIQLSTGYLNSVPKGIQLRTITDAKLLNAPKRPKAKSKGYLNEENDDCCAFEGWNEDHCEVSARRHL